MPPTPQTRVEHRVPTSPRVESGGVSVAIGEEHRDGTRKHGQGEQEQKVGDEHAPHKQGNSQHFLTRAAHLQDGGEKVDRAGKAANPGQMEANDGDVHSDHEVVGDAIIRGINIPITMEQLKGYAIQVV